MGLVKTRRLAAMQKQQRAIHLRQGYGGLKAGMKPPMKGDGRKACSRQFPFEERTQGKITRQYSRSLTSLCGYSLF